LIIPQNFGRGDKMNALQLDFFKTEEESEIEILSLAINEVKASNDKVRKKLFAENGKLTKEIMELRMRLEILEAGLCLESRFQS
jgi:hypothetical protein